MFQITFMVCLLENLVSCKAATVTLVGELKGARTCIVSGQLEAVKYVETHPRWIVRGWRCEEVELAKKAI